jgi:hypothetical protein
MPKHSSPEDRVPGLVIELLSNVLNQLRAGKDTGFPMKGVASTHRRDIYVPLILANARCELDVEATISVQASPKHRFYEMVDAFIQVCCGRRPIVFKSVT